MPVRTTVGGIRFVNGQSMSTSQGGILALVALLVTSVCQPSRTQR